MTLKITVKLHGILRRRRPAGVEGASHHPFLFSMAAGATVLDLAQDLGIDDGLVNGAGRATSWFAPPGYTWSFNP